MNWGWFFLAVILLVAGAAIFEAFIWRGIRRPLSRHAVNKRRWDDKNNTEKDELVISTENWVNSKTGEVTQKTWAISKDPQHQARAMMPREDKGKKRK